MRCMQTHFPVPRFISADRCILVCERRNIFNLPCFLTLIRHFCPGTYCLNIIIKLIMTDQLQTLIFLHDFKFSTFFIFVITHLTIYSPASGNTSCMLSSAVICATISCFLILHQISIFPCIFRHCFFIKRSRSKMNQTDLFIVDQSKYHINSIFIDLNKSSHCCPPLHSVKYNYNTT